MTIFTTLPFKGKNFAKYFSTKSKCCTDDSTRLSKNKEFFEKKEGMETPSNLANEKSLSNEALFDLLKRNKQASSDNMCLAERSIGEGDKISKRATSFYSHHKYIITEEKQVEIDEALASNKPSTRMFPSNPSQEERSLFAIEKMQKKLIGALFKANSVNEALCAKGDIYNTSRDEIVDSSKLLMQEFNSLSDNIKNYTNNNEVIRQELSSRKVSLTEDFLATHMDTPGTYDGDIE